MRCYPLTLVVALALTTGCSVSPGRSSSSHLPRTGDWRAVLDTPGGELPFGLRIERRGKLWAAEIRNGDESVRLPVIQVSGGRVLFDFAHYDSRIEATVDESGRELVGEWTKTRGPGTSDSVPFRASFGDPKPFSRAAGPRDARDAFVGRWRVDFSGGDDPAIGVFGPHGDAAVRGTFLTTVGDYRYLAGGVVGDELQLSTFDGGHAFLFRASVSDSGELRGNFWSGNWWHETWTATRDDKADLSDAFERTRWKDGVELSSLVFPDLDGVERSLADSQFAGRARIIQVFGSWCPNCHDSSELLRELHEEYGPRGLAILGIAFELTGDFERDARQVRRYVARHRLRYPVLLAGLAAKAEATRTLGALDRVRSYPTTIFLRADGSVRAVHSGFAGPATGSAHTALRQKFRALIEELLVSVE
jgi:thiol-disulfide isomerase/thioredoxin